MQKVQFEFIIQVINQAKYKSLEQKLILMQTNLLYCINLFF